MFQVETVFLKATWHSSLLIFSSFIINTESYEIICPLGPCLTYSVIVTLSVPGLILNLLKLLFSLLDLQTLFLDLLFPSSILINSSFPGIILALNFLPMIILSFFNKLLWHYKYNTFKIDIFIYICIIKLVNLLKQIFWFFSNCEEEI